MFKGFRQEYPYEHKWQSVPIWQLGVEDVRPFENLACSMAEIIDALRGWPLKSFINDSSLTEVWEMCEDTIETEELEEKISCILNIEVPPEKYYWYDHYLLSMSPSHFAALRRCILEGVVTSYEIARIVNCPQEWVLWCEKFCYAGDGRCLCLNKFQRVKRGPRAAFLSINSINEDGDCVDDPCYVVGSESVVKELWQRYGGKFVAPARGSTTFKPELNPYLLISGHCKGISCKCSPMAMCKQ